MHLNTSGKCSNRPGMPRLCAGTPGALLASKVVTKWCPQAPAACVSRDRGRSKTLRRSIDVNASMATHRPGKRYHPGCRYEVNLSKVQPIRHRHPARTLLGGTCSRVSGKRGRIWANFARRACLTAATAFDLPTDRSTSLVEIWRSLSLR